MSFNDFIFQNVYRKLLKGKNMPTGKVKWFNNAKGFGFIQPDEGGNDVFVHITALQAAGIASLNEDDNVSYDLEEGRDGRSAAGNLKLV